MLLNAATCLFRPSELECEGACNGVQRFGCLGVVVFLLLWTTKLCVFDNLISHLVGRGRMLNICAPWVGVDLLVGEIEKAEGRDAASPCGHCESGDV